MKSVNEIKAKKSFAGPGMWGYDAEATVQDEDGKEVYVHVNVYDMFRHYTVSNESGWDVESSESVDDDPDFLEKLLAEPETDVDEPQYIEMYKRMSDAKDSEYYKIFDVLNKVVTRMEKGLE